MSAWTLCIDFGTAFSKAAAAPKGAWANFDPALVRPLMLGAHLGAGDPFLLESAVFVDEGQLLFGRAACSRAEELAHTKRAALRSFKTLLSANDVDRTLNTNAVASLDPGRRFKMRDLVVLYMAYLLAAVEAATALDAMLRHATQIERRCAAPAWREARASDLHASIAGLFGEAEAVRELAGASLLHGISVERAEELLLHARAQCRPYEMGLVFEAPAAAAYSSIGLDQGGSHFIVIDMGAGTTDIAALAHSEGDIAEFAEARTTLKQAGDFIDRVIANVVIDAARHAKTAAQQGELWRVLMGQMRDLKETLFAEGRVQLRHEGRPLSLALRQLEQDADFKAFLRDLTGAYLHSLAIAGEAAARRGFELNSIAVGGGAAAPFIQKLIRTKPRANVRIQPFPATPDWAHANAFQGNLAPIFPQLAIAIGGALAPEAILAWRAPSAVA